MKASARSISLARFWYCTPAAEFLHEVGVPAVHAAQVGEPAGDERPGQVEDRRGGVVDLEQPLRVGLAGLRGEREPVDRVAAVGRQGDALPGLGGRAARLGELAGQPADLHDRHLGGVGQHHGHRQQRAQLALDVGRGHPVEGLGAVPALQEKASPAATLAILLPQLVALAGEDQRRQRAQLGHHLRPPRRGRRSSAAAAGPSACSAASVGTRPSSLGCREVAGLPLVILGSGTQTQ